MVLSSGCKSGFVQFLIPPSSSLSSLPPLCFLLPPSFSSFSLFTLALALTCVPGFSLPSQQPLTPEDSDQGTRCPVATQHHLLIMPFRAFSASNGMRKLMPSSDLLQSVFKKKGGGLSAFLSSIFRLGREMDADACEICSDKHVLCLIPHHSLTSSEFWSSLLYVAGPE